MNNPIIEINLDKICAKLWKILLQELEKESQFKYSESSIAKEVLDFGARMKIKVEVMTGNSMEVEGLILSEWKGDKA